MHKVKKNDIMTKTGISANNSGNLHILIFWFYIWSSSQIQTLEKKKCLLPKILECAMETFLCCLLLISRQNLKSKYIYIYCTGSILTGTHNLKEGVLQGCLIGQLSIYLIFFSITAVPMTKYELCRNSVRGQICNMPLFEGYFLTCAGKNPFIVFFYIGCFPYQRVY